jgi:hypothetical protein
MPDISPANYQSHDSYQPCGNFHIIVRHTHDFDHDCTSDRVSAAKA